MEQRIVFKVSMSSEKCMSKAMELVANKAHGVSSMAIIGDGKDRLEVVGVDLDVICLGKCLRKKFGHVDLVNVEEVNDRY